MWDRILEKQKSGCRLGGFENPTVSDTKQKINIQQLLCFEWTQPGITLIKSWLSTRLPPRDECKNALCFCPFFWRTCCLTKASSQMWIRVKSQKAWNQLSVLITCRWQTCLQLEDSHTEISDDDGFLQKTESTEQEVF